MNLLSSAILLSSFVVTAYQSKPSQTDNTPFRTSINEQVSWTGVAVHPSLLCPSAKVNVKGGKFILCRRDLPCCQPNAVHYFDAIFIEDVGVKVVTDVMANDTKMNSKVDVWTVSAKGEKEHHNRFGARKLKVWLFKKHI